MSGIKRLRLPLDQDAVRALKLGDQVALDGEVVLCAGLPTHRRLVEHLEVGAPLPFDLRGAALLHLGSYSRMADGRLDLLYVNPTTSSRFDAYMPTIIRGLGLRVTGGKGGLDAASAQAMREAGCVYLSFIGGGCTLLSRAIREVVDLAWDDLIIHYRLVKVRVEGLGPGTVAIDAHGNSLYADGARTAEGRLPEILAELDATRPH